MRNRIILVCSALFLGSVFAFAQNPVSVTQWLTNVVDTNSGTKSAGTLRVVLATDQPALTNKLLVTPDSVALPANQSVNVSQIAGTNTVTAGVAGLLAVGGNVAIAGAATANPVPVGGIFQTTPTTLTNGQTASLQFTAAQNAKTDLTTIAGTAPTTAGKIDIKGADGDVFVRQATAANLNATVVQSTAANLNATVAQSTASNLNAQVQGAAASGASKAGNPVQTGGVFNTTQPTVTTGQAVEMQMTARGAQIVATGVDSFATNVAQFGGTNVVTGTGAGGSGIPRVTISNDSSLAANQSVNLAQVAGNTTSTGVGAAGTGTARVVDVASGTTGSAPPTQASYVGGLQSGATGGLLGGITVCDSKITVSLTTNTQLISGVSARHVYVCSINLVVAAATNVALVSGTGSVCGTGTGAMAGGTTAATGWNFAANGGIAQGTGIGWIARTAATGDNVCLLVSAANQTSGVITYAIY